MTKFLTGLLALIVIACVGIYIYNAPSVPENSGDYEVAYMDNAPEGYELRGIKKDEYQVWEDGMRTEGKEGTYEWWYVDTAFDDGTTAAVVFYTKYRFDVAGPAHPTATLDIDFPDGSRRHWMINEEKGTVIRAAKDKADVMVQDSYIRYVDEENYEVYFKDEGVEFTLNLKRRVPMWRPDAGHIYFDKERKDFIAWYPAVPAADATATLTMDGETREFKGSGYHDHNWGNKFMAAAMNHWYWGRGTIGDYHIVVANMVSREANGFSTVPLFYLAKDGEVIAGGSEGASMVRKDTVEHPYTGKFYDNNQIYTFNGDDGTKYTIDYTRKRDIIKHHHVNDFPWYKRIVAHLMRINSTYLRSVGDVKVTIEYPDGEKEEAVGEAIWEQMFFGNNKEPIVWN